MKARILVIDDEEILREDIAALIRQEGHDCRTAPDGEGGVEVAKSFDPEVALSDLVLPGTNGIETLRQLKAVAPECAVIMMTAFGTMESAIEAFRAGAVDYLVKPFVPGDLIHRINRCLEQRQLQRELRYLRNEISEAATGTTIVGESGAIQRVREVIARIAPSDTSVLITGETGTGKELVARALHELRFDGGGPFVAVNCSALSRELLESELFGHVRGAFTGAHKDKPGLFELASRGTLFLDEICEMPIDLQPKLLRAIESHEIFRVGSTRPYEANARIVAATNRDIAQQIRDRQFREDLYFRMAVVEIQIPPLRERRDDIPLLTERLIRRLNKKLSRHVKGADSSALRELMSAPWPGNVRELENVLERAMLFSDGEMLRPNDFPPSLTGRSDAQEVSDNLKDAVRAYKREHINRVLEASGGNRELAAGKLGVDPSTIYRHLSDSSNDGPRAVEPENPDNPSPQTLDPK